MAVAPEGVAIVVLYLLDLIPRELAPSTECFALGFFLLHEGAQGSPHPLVDVVDTILFVNLDKTIHLGFGQSMKWQTVSIRKDGGVPQSILG